MTPEARKRWMAARIKHGAYMNDSESPTHYIWRSMLARCNNIKDKSYTNYGGRGIKVYERWLKFENFLVDMGERPLKLSIERIDNDGNYEPSNCKWATLIEQGNNTRGNRRFKQGEEIKTLTGWALKLNMSKQMLTYRWEQWGTFIRGQTWQEL